MTHWAVLKKVVCIDTTDGFVKREWEKFVDSKKSPWLCIEDNTKIKAMFGGFRKRYPSGKKKKVKRKEYYTYEDTVPMNSGLIKDEITSCRKGKSGTLSFHKYTCKEFLQSMTMEVKKVDEKKDRAMWDKKYSDCPNHYFSALVYAFGGMLLNREDIKIDYVEKVRRKEALNKKVDAKEEDDWVLKGIDWEMENE